MAQKPTQELRQFLQTRIRELEDDLQALHRALDALGGAAAGESDTPAPTSERAGGHRRGRRSRTNTATQGAVAPEALEQLLGTGEGLTTSTLAQKTGGPSAQVLTLLKELEAAGRVRRTGARRATRWHLAGEGGPPEPPAEDGQSDGLSVPEELDEEEIIRRRAEELSKLVA